MEDDEIFDGQFSDLNEDDDGGDFGDEEIGEEEMDQFDDDEELLDGPEGQFEGAVKAKPVEEKENVEVTQRFFDKLRGQLERKPGAGSLKLFLQVFVDVLNDETSDRFRKKAFITTDLNVLNAIVKFGVEEFPAILETAAGLSVQGDEVVLKREKMGVLIKTLCNNLVKFLGQQVEPTMQVFVCRAIRKHIRLFRVSVVGRPYPAKIAQTRPGVSPALGRLGRYACQTRGAPCAQRGRQIRR